MRCGQRLVSRLLEPARFGEIDAANRIVMAPLTRGRAGEDGMPQPVMIDYYRQRASAGLIISEATSITRHGLGWVGAPGIWSDPQVAAWQSITRAVHDAGGRIVVQLWHMGRLSHPDFTGLQPVSCSSILAPGTVPVPSGERKPYVKPRALDLHEIAALVDDYVHAAVNAMRAGFDGVEVHAANGYLLDQFLRDSSNLRNDRYGGSIANRMRFLMEVTDAVADAIGAGRVGVRLSPNGESRGVDDSEPELLFTAVAAALNERGLAYLHLREQNPDSLYSPSDVPHLSPSIRPVFDGPLILSGDYTPYSATQAVASRSADAIAFGRPFIANPDLVHRIATGLPIAEPNAATFYTPGPIGYVDYPAWQKELG